MDEMSEKPYIMGAVDYVLALPRLYETGKHFAEPFNNLLTVRCQDVQSSTSLPEYDFAIISGRKSNFVYFVFAAFSLISHA